MTPYIARDCIPAVARGEELHILRTDSRTWCDRPSEEVGRALVAARLLGVDREARDRPEGVCDRCLDLWRRGAQNGK